MVYKNSTFHRESGSIRHAFMRSESDSLPVPATDPMNTA